MSETENACDCLECAIKATIIDRLGPSIGADEALEITRALASLAGFVLADAGENSMRACAMLRPLPEGAR